MVVNIRRLVVGLVGFIVCRFLRFYVSFGLPASCIACHLNLVGQKVKCEFVNNLVDSELQYLDLH